MDTSNKTVTKRIILLLLLCLPLSGQAQTNLQQTIRGQVIDEDTRIPLIGANIVIVDSQPLLGATSDFDGNFKIENVPVGRLTLRITYLGYEDALLSNQLIGAGKQLILEIPMREAILSTEVVVVTAGKGNKGEALNEMAVVSTRSFSVEETKRYAAGISDPARMISANAGVVSNNGDEDNAIIIRGNSPKGLLWRLEGVEIPNPNHFAGEGASSGGISILSANMLSRSDFYTGAFPADIGNALSGAFDIRLRNGNNEKREYTFQAGVLGMEAAVEGPFKVGGQSSFLFNYRYSTLALLTDLGVGIVDEGEVTTYQDASFKVNLPTKNYGIFSIYGIGGLSLNSYDTPSDTEKETYETNMGAAGVNHSINFGKKTLLTNNISLSGTQLLDDSSDPFIGYQFLEDKKKTFWRYASSLRTKFNARHILETGLIATRQSYQFIETEKDPEEEPPFDDYEYLNDKGNANSLQAYTSWKFRITDELTLVNGLHLLHFGLNNKTTIEPRSALKWRLKENQSLSLGFGLHSRIESLDYYLVKYVDENGVTSQPNTDLDFTKARHFVLGYDNQFSPNWFFKTEFYYQSLYDVPVAADSTDIFSALILESGFTTEPLVNEGEGENYGVELSVQRFFNKDFYLLFNTSVYQSTYTAIDGKTRNTPFSSNFGCNALVGKEYTVGKNGQNIFGINIRGTWAGNKRYLPIDLAQSIEENQTVRDFDRAFEDRYADFIKFDLQLSYRKNKKKRTGEFRLDLLNVTNRANEQFKFFNSDTQDIFTATSTGLIPSLSYRLEF